MNKIVSNKECATIRMTVKNDDDFLSVFSASKTPVISSDVADFIENSTAALSPKEPVALHIYSDCIDKQEQQEYRCAIKEYYVQRYRANEQERKRNRCLVLLLTVVGMLILSVSFFLNSANRFLWAEMIDIAAWVFLWEAVDIGAFHNRDLRVKRLRYRSYMTMDIEYHALHEQ